MRRRRPKFEICAPRRTRELPLSTAVQRIDEPRQGGNPVGMIAVSCVPECRAVTDARGFTIKCRFPALGASAVRHVVLPPAVTRAPGALATIET